MKFNKLVPELGVIDFEKSLKFYTEILGFKVEYSRGDVEREEKEESKKENKFAFISFEGSQFMIDEIIKPNNKENKFITGKLEKPFGRGINFQIEVKDIKPILDRLAKNNYPLHMEVCENWYRKGGFLLGSREFMVLDPEGYLLRFSQDIGKKKV